MVNNDILLYLNCFFVLRIIITSIIYKLILTNRFGGLYKPHWFGADVQCTPGSCGTASRIQIRRSVSVAGLLRSNGLHRCGRKRGRTGHRRCRYGCIGLFRCGHTGRHKPWCFHDWRWCKGGECSKDNGGGKKAGEARATVVFGGNSTPADPNAFVCCASKDGDSL